MLFVFEGRETGSLLVSRLQVLRTEEAYQHFRANSSPSRWSSLRVFFLPEHLDQNIHLSGHSRTSDFGGAREVTERIGGFLVLSLSNGERRVWTRVRSVASRKQSLRCASSTARSDPRAWRFAWTAVTVTSLGETS